MTGFVHVAWDMARHVPRPVWVAAGVVVLGWLLLARLRGRHISTPVGPDSAGTTIVVVTIVAALAGFVYAKTRPARAASPVPVVEHVAAASHPLLSGWQIVTLAGIVAVVGLAAWINRK